MVEYGLIGYPLGHSYSAEYFNHKFKAENIDAHYDLYPIRSIEDIDELIDSHPDLRGLNVTIPYKEKIMSRLTDVDAEAKSIGAVNVIRIAHSPDGSRSLSGFNSDWLAFRHTIETALAKGRIAAGCKALVLGTGGASKAISHALNYLGIDALFVSRSPENSSLQPVIGYDDVDRDVMESHMLIVNTTPLGMYPDVMKCPELPYRFLTPEHFLYDLVYNPETTEFMKQGLEYGARVCNGLEMLYGQAEIAYRIWNHES